MSKVYRNKTGILTVSGKVKEISADRTNVTITSAVYNSGEKKWGAVEYTANVSLPVGEDFTVGTEVMAVGYQSGQGKLTANALFAGKGYYEEAELGFLAGEVVKAVLNEEKNADGSAKLKQDGTARKRHFDIFVRTLHMDGEEALHIVKVYDGRVTPGEKTQLEKTMARFKPYMEEGKSATVFIATDVAQSYSYEATDRDGNTVVRTNHSHMGYKSLDIAFGEVRENARTQSAPEQTQTQPEQTPAQASTQTPAQETVQEQATTQTPAEQPAQTTETTTEKAPVQETPAQPNTEMNVPESLADVEFTMG